MSRWRLEKMEEFDSKRKTDEIRIEGRERKMTEKRKRQRGSGKVNAETRKQKYVSGKVES